MGNKQIQNKTRNGKGSCIPEVGKEYHFFDDGKTSPSRHYICRCERVITPEEAKNIIFEPKDYDSEEEKTHQTTLYDIWKDEVSDCYWLFSEDTDFFVEISCPNYDDHMLWVARTKGGGWFTLDIQSWWQGGEVDVTGDIFNDTVEYWKGEGEDEKVRQYLEEKY